MARNRMIKPEIWTDEKFVELSSHARLLFIGSWNFADDNGIVEYSPKRLRFQIFPGDDIKIEPLIEEIIKVGLWYKYGKERQFIFIVNFPKHQTVDRPSFRFNILPDEKYLNAHGYIVEDAPKDRRKIVEYSASARAKRERKGERERKRESKSKRGEVPDISLELQEICFRVLGFIPAGNLVDAVHVGLKDQRAALLPGGALGFVPVDLIHVPGDLL